MCKEILSLAVKKIGGQVATANAIRSLKPDCRVEQGHVWKWLNRSVAEVPPAEYVLAIAAATCWEYTPHRLRPDLYPNPSDAMPVGVAEAA
jgi:DNA-binding transcriptional regulator YdaS (Cro superfamily)